MSYWTTFDDNAPYCYTPSGEVWDLQGDEWTCSSDTVRREVAGRWYCPMHASRAEMILRDRARRIPATVRRAVKERWETDEHRLCRLCQTVVLDGEATEPHHEPPFAIIRRHDPALIHQTHAGCNRQRNAFTVPALYPSPSQMDTPEGERLSLAVGVMHLSEQLSTFISGERMRRDQRRKPPADPTILRYIANRFLIERAVTVEEMERLFGRFVLNLLHDTTVATRVAVWECGHVVPAWADATECSECRVLQAVA